MTTINLGIIGGGQLGMMLTEAAKSMPLDIAAGFPVTYGTAYSALVSKAKIKKNEICLVLGATGGVGITAIEISKAVGAKVIATASTDEKLKIAKVKTVNITCIILLVIFKY